MPLGTILLILLVLVLIGALSTWGYSGSWGYGPSGICLWHKADQFHRRCDVR
jgi:hypothetical protein